MITRRSLLGGAAAAAAVVTTRPRPARALAADAETPLGESILANKPALRDPDWSLARAAQIFGTATPGPTWPRAEMITWSADADGTEVAKWLPPPLEVTDPARIMVFVANYPMTKLGFGYREAAVFLYARYQDQEYLHCPWMVVDDDTALILGREFLGFPKKMAEIEADVGGARGRVVRKGLPVLEVQGSDPEPLETAALFAHPVVNVRGVPGQPSQLLQMGGSETFHRGESLKLEVSFGKSDLDPLYRLGVARRQQGMAVVVDVGIGSQGQTDGIDLTGTEVPAGWMTTAYPFRVW